MAFDVSRFVPFQKKQNWAGPVFREFFFFKRLIQMEKATAFKDAEQLNFRQGNRGRGKDFAETVILFQKPVIIRPVAHLIAPAFDGVRCCG